jgi:hypothetical protein
MINAGSALARAASQPRASGERVLCVIAAECSQCSSAIKPKSLAGNDPESLSASSSFDGCQSSVPGCISGVDYQCTLPLAPGPPGVNAPSSDIFSPGTGVPDVLDMEVEPSLIASSDAQAESSDATARNRIAHSAKRLLTGDEPNSGHI